jgi:hypothetical protein
MFLSTCVEKSHIFLSACQQMSRRRDAAQSRESCDESDDDTDSECEYEMNVDTCAALARTHRLSERALMEKWKSQSGLCRFTNFPFSTGDYKPTIVPRKCSEPLSDSNFCIVIDKLASMRSATGDNWRTFVRFLQIVAKEIDI